MLPPYICFGCINRCTGYSVVFFPASGWAVLRRGAFVNLHRQFSFCFIQTCLTPSYSPSSRARVIQLVCWLLSNTRTISEESLQLSNINHYLPGRKIRGAIQDFIFPYQSCSGIEVRSRSGPSLSNGLCAHRYRGHGAYRVQELFESCCTAYLDSYTYENHTLRTSSSISN